MNDSKINDNDKKIPKDSSYENEEIPKIESENNIEKLEENNKSNENNNKIMNEEQENIENNDVNNSKIKENNDYNKNKELSNEEKNNFDDSKNQNNDNINDNAKNNEIQNDNKDSKDIKDNNEINGNNNINDDYNDDNNNNNKDNYKGEEIINDNKNENKSININPDEKLDESNNNENNIRFSSIKNDEFKRKSDVNNQKNEPSGFIYDDEENHNNNNNFNNENETNDNFNLNKNDNNNNEINEFGFNNDINHDYEQDFDFGNNQNNFINNNNYNDDSKNDNNIIENNQRKGQENKTSLLNSQNNNSNYNFNPYSSNDNTNNYKTNYNQNSGQKYDTHLTQNQNQTNTNFIPQETPIMRNLNNNFYTIPQNIENNHHPDYDPQYKKYEELPEDSDGQNLDPNKMGKDSTCTQGTQIANTIMGAGILSIPIIMRYLGFLIGIFLIVFLALTTIYSVYILIRCHEITGKSGYSMFGKITMGKFGSILIKIIIIINNMGLCIAYFRIFGEVVQTIIQAWVSSDSFWANNWHNYIYILICGLIMIFFIFIKNISSLKKVAYLGVSAVLVFSISLTILLAYKYNSNYLESNINWDFFLPNCTFSEAFHAIPTVFLAFLFQFNVFPIYLSLKHRNMKSMMKATKYGVGYSLIIFLIVGIIGFLLYGLNMGDTILDSFSEDMIKYKNISTFIKVLIIIICISFVTTCLTSFPILFWSLRENFINSLLFCYKSCGKNQNNEEVKINQGKFEKNNNYKIISNKAIACITIILYFLTLALAILLPKLKIIFSVVGATAGTFIAFILPNLFYIRICKMSGKSFNIVLPLIFFAFGLFFLILSITVNFI